MKTHPAARALTLLVSAAMAILAAAAAQAAELGRGVPPVVQGPPAGAFGANPAVGFQLSLCPPAQLFPEKYDVMGLRLNLLYGVNANVRGLDVGLMNAVSGDFAGLQMGLFNSAATANDGCVQVGAVNSCPTLQGCQLGLVNMAKQASAFQFGLINMCDEMNGVQIGLVNFIFKSGGLVFCPIFNAQY